MTRLLTTAALALSLSLVGGAALACGPEGCKDKAADGKSACCCDKMKDGHKDHAGHGDAAQKPDTQKPAAPGDAPAPEHKH
jgi:hypothetical protein